MQGYWTRRFCSWVQQRYVFAFMGFAAMLVAYGTRLGLSIAITVMAKRPNESPGDENTCPGSLPKNTEGTIATTTTTTTTTTGVYEWDEHLQGIILSSFYWGYVVTQIPGGMIAERFGGKHSVGLGLLLTSILTLLIPFSIYKGGPNGLIITRVVSGFFEGVTVPGLTAMISQWAPPEERSKTGAFVHGGAPLGTILTTVLSGLILKYYHWSTVFYFFGALGIVWYVAWLLLVYNNPAEHPFISAIEAKYIAQALSEHVHEDPPPVPWGRMLRSTALWALVAVQIGHDWTFYTVASDLPKYMANVLHFDVDQNGYLSALPYLGMWLCSSATAWLMDFVVARRYLSNTAVRKLGSVLGSLGPGIFLLAAAFAKCEKALVVGFFVLGVTLLGCGLPSLKINALDLSPNYSGTVMAVVNGISSSTGIATPYLVGVLTPNQTFDEWRKVFWIVFVILVVTDGLYLLFGSGKVADWNDPDYVLEDPEKKKNNTKRDTEQGARSSLAQCYLYYIPEPPKRVNFTADTK